MSLPRLCQRTAGADVQKPEYGKRNVRVQMNGLVLFGQTVEAVPYRLNNCNKNRKISV